MQMTDKSSPSSSASAIEVPNEKVLLLNKPLGMTPLELIQGFKKRFPKYEKLKIGYAGRLDPMARGLMVCLVGDESKKQKETELKTKDYVFEALFGVSTDTYDVLGLVSRCSNFSYCTWPLEGTTSLF